MESFQISPALFQNKTHTDRDRFSFSKLSEKFLSFWHKKTKDSWSKRAGAKVNRAGRRGRGLHDHDKVIFKVNRLSRLWGRK